MAGFNPAPLPSLGSLFNDPVAGGAGVGAAAPLPSLATLYEHLGAPSLAAASVSFSYAPAAVALISSRKLVAAAVSYTLTLQASTGSKLAQPGMSAPVPLPSLSTLFQIASGARILPANRVTYALTLQAVTLRKGRGLVAGTVSYVLSVAPGQRDLEVNGDRLTYALTLNAATLTRNRAPLVASKLTYSLTIQASTGSKQTSTAFTLPALPVAYALTIRASLSALGSRRLTCSVVTYTLAIRDVQLRSTGKAEAGGSAIPFQFTAPSRPKREEEREAPPPPPRRPPKIRPPRPVPLPTFDVSALGIVPDWAQQLHQLVTNAPEERRREAQNAEAMRLMQNMEQQIQREQRERVQKVMQLLSTINLF
jgi:hypothetical protein